MASRGIDGQTMDELVEDVERRRLLSRVVLANTRSKLGVERWTGRQQAWE